MSNYSSYDEIIKNGMLMQFRNDEQFSLYAVDQPDYDSIWVCNRCKSIDIDTSQCDCDGNMICNCELKINIKDHNMIDTSQLETIASDTLHNYIADCGCQTSAQISQALAKLISVSAIYLCVCIGQAQAAELFVAAKKFVLKPKFGFYAGHNKTEH